MTCTGKRPNSQTAPTRDRTQPPATTAAAPATGTRAAVPGNGVADVNVTAEKTIAPMPTQLRRDIPRGDSRPSRGVASARIPPTASSQARVGSEKKAQGSLALVSQIEKAREQAARSAIATTTAENRGRALPRDAQPVLLSGRHQIREATKSSAGHTR